MSEVIHSPGYLPLVLREPRRFRAVSIVPGNVIVECQVCGARRFGVTAVEVIAAFARHEATAHKPSCSDGG